MAGQLDRRMLASQPTVIVDLSRVEELTTAALAELVAFRKRLLREGFDLALVGLHGRARTLYDVLRLAGVLPAVGA